MSRAADRVAARREARVRRAELRLFAAARAYAEQIDRTASTSSLTGDGGAPSESGAVVDALAELEAAALRYAEIAPARRRHRRGRRS